jgi:hypothetical protein
VLHGVDLGDIEVRFGPSVKLNEDVLVLMETILGLRQFLNGFRGMGLKRRVKDEVKGTSNTLNDSIRHCASGNETKEALFHSFEEFQIGEPSGWIGGTRDSRGGVVWNSVIVRASTTQWRAQKTLE